jgi:hypothetical protein
MERLQADGSDQQSKTGNDADLAKETGHGRHLCERVETGRLQQAVFNA